MMNGHDSAADLTQAEWDHYRARVIRHDAQLSDLTGIPEAVRATQRVQRDLMTEVGRIRAIAEELKEWKEDSKVQYIHDLRGKNALLEAAAHKADEERERDKLDLRRTVRAAVIAAIVTALVTWGAAKLTAPPQVSPITQGAKQP